jgi:hypothetical protein
MSSKILCIILILLVLPSFIFAQTWKSSIDLNLTVDDADRIDLYTNADGNNIILHTSSQLKYYLFSYNGTQVRTATIDNSLSGYPRLSCISGYLDTVIVLWKEGSYISGKRTTDAGQNWTNLTSNELEYDYCNGLEVWPSEDELHVVWSESDSDEDGYYETYHRPLKYNGTWGTKKQVTDYSGEEGGFPSVTTSANRVHVAYTECYSTDPVGNRGTSKNRDKYNTSWQTPLEIFDDAGRSYVVATSQKLHAFYYDFAPGMGQFGYNLYHCYRNFTSSSWSTPYLILSYGANLDVNTVDMAVTSNDSLHIVYNGEYYKEYTGSWQNTYSYTNAGLTFCNKMYANSNDIYIVWIEEDGEDYTLMLKQRDYVPLPPQNLYVDFSINNHPTIHWDANTEADLKGYHVYRDIPRISQGVRLTTNPITATYYVDDEYIQGESYPAYYYAKVVDQYDNLSDISNYDYVWVMPTDKDVVNFSVTLTPAHFELFQNYPNPFNPTTTINYALPQDGNVTISIYSVNGEKVKSVLNQFMEKGFHTVEWNGTNQNGSPVSTGIYIYELIAGDQKLAKKMFLAK